MTPDTDDGSFPQADAVLRMLHANLTSQIAWQIAQSSVPEPRKLLSYSEPSERECHEKRYTVMARTDSGELVRSVRLREIDVQELPHTSDEAGVSIVELVAVRLAAAGDLVAKLEAPARSSFTTCPACRRNSDNRLRDTSEQLRRLSQHLLLRQIGRDTFGEVLAAAADVLGEVRTKWAQAAAKSPTAAPDTRTANALAEASLLIKEVFYDLPKLFDMSRNSVEATSS